MVGVQNYYLPLFRDGTCWLTDAGLDNNEKNLVMTAINGNFSPQRIAQELRNQFPEGEVKRRDQHRKFQSYLGGENLEETESDLDVAGNTMQELMDDGLNDEGAALVVEAEQEAQEAMAALFQARRTLKEARQKQHQVKQSRRYYQGGSSSGRSTGGSSFPSKPRDDSQLDCLRCGQRGHRAANCPQKATASQVDVSGGSGPEHHHAPFVCFADLDQSGTGDELPNLAGYAQAMAVVTCEEAYLQQKEGQGLTTGGGGQGHVRDRWRCYSDHR